MGRHFFFFYHGTRGTFVAGYEVHCADVRLVYYVERDFFVAARGSVIAVCAVRLLRNMPLVHCGMRGLVLTAV